MTKTQGIIRIENPEYRRRKVVRSIVSQTILQCLTFGAAILTYHYVAMPQVTNEAYIDGRLDGHKCALFTASIESANVPFPEVCKGWKPQWTPNK